MLLSGEGMVFSLSFFSFFLSFLLFCLAALAASLAAWMSEVSESSLSEVLDGSTGGCFLNLALDVDGRQVTCSTAGISTGKEAADGTGVGVVVVTLA